MIELGLSTSDLARGSEIVFNRIPLHGAVHRSYLFLEHSYGTSALRTSLLESCLALIWTRRV